jgi:cytochrome c peroxidase
MSRHLHKAATIAVSIVLGSTAIALSQARDPGLVTRPAGTTPFEAPAAELESLGEALFADESLSPNGMSCETCHADLAGYNETFRQPYPHPVQMASGMFGIASVDAEQMVQLCMVVPMAAEPLAWDSRELAALTAYVHKVQAEFAQTPASE